MTDRSAGDGDFLTVEQVARLRAITPAAVRAQLRSGTLAGEQVLQGQRTVWRIPASAVGRPQTSPPPPARQDPPPPPSPSPSPSPGSVRPAAASSTVPSARVEALEAEVRRLRRQLAALSDAHRRLLDTVTAGLADDLR